jgi:hypothetical protein
MQDVRRFRPSTVSRRLSVVAGFYRTCVIDGVLEHSPADYVCRPTVVAVDYPLETARSGVDIGGDARQRDVHDRDVEVDRERRDVHRDQDARLVSRGQGRGEEQGDSDACTGPIPDRLGNSSRRY